MKAAMQAAGHSRFAISQFVSPGSASRHQKCATAAAISITIFVN
jgi:hypothetical protein